MSRPLPLTIVIPVRNEEKNLPACLALLPSVECVVVVDSGSTDATAAIAQDAGADLVQFRWPGGFPKKRNWVLQTYPFKTPWVLFLDADERLTPEFIALLGPALARDDLAGYWLSYNNHFMGGRLRHGVPQRKLALFRVGAGLYERIEDAQWSGLDMEVHEHPILEGRVEAIAAPIEHQDSQGLHKFIGRHNDYSSWEARRLIAMKSDRQSWAKLTPRQRIKYASLESWWFAPAYFLFTYVIRAGFLDGGKGLAYAFLKYAYFAEVRLKIIELKARDGGA
jgi:glycosyltransferase involved in cell wall biosynthesis